MKNSNFEKAMGYVRVTYPWLFHEGLIEIELVPADSKWLGRCISCGFTEDNNHSTRIEISNGPHKVADFIDTIVHELIHSYDFYTGVKVTERRAQDLAFEAVETYKKANNIPVWA